MDTSINLSVNELVTDALQVMRVVTEFNNISGYDLQLGVKVLNQIIGSLNSAGSTIPFYYSIQFQTVAGQSDYYIGQGPDADVVNNYFSTLTYVNVYWGNVKYPVTIIEDYDALSVAIQDNLQFLPANARYFKENDSAGNTYTVLKFLFPPDQAYTCEIRGKPTLDTIAVNGTIYSLPEYYYFYLKLELVRRLIPYYGRDDVWTPMLQQQYQEAITNIKSTNEFDMRIRVGNALMNYPGPYYYKLGVRY